MEHNVEIAGRPRAKRKGEKGGTLPQNWPIQNAQQSVYPHNKLSTFPMLRRLLPCNRIHTFGLPKPPKENSDPFSSQMAVNWLKPLPSKSSFSLCPLIRSANFIYKSQSKTLGGPGERLCKRKVPAVKASGHYHSTYPCEWKGLRQEGGWIKCREMTLCSDWLIFCPSLLSRETSS